VVGDVGDAPAGVVVGGGSAWVVSPTNVAHGETATGTVTPINPDTATATEPFEAGQQAGGIAYGDGSLWVAATEEARLYRFDPSNPAKPAAFDVGTAPTGIAVTPQAVWITDAGDNTVSKLDPATGTPISKPVQVGLDPTSVRVGSGGVWVANHLDRTVSRINPASGQVLATIPIGDGPSGIAITDGAVWVTTDHASAMVRIDPTTNHTRTIPVPGAPRAVAAVGDRVYVASAASYEGHSGGTLRVRVAGPPPGAAAWPIIDPTFSADFRTVLVGAATTDTLVGYARISGPASNSLVPDLAEALPTPTPDMTSDPFTLRSGIRFSTGQRLRATDVRASFERAMLEDPDDVGISPLAAIRGAATARTCTTPAFPGIRRTESARCWTTVGSGRSAETMCSSSPTGSNGSRPMASLRRQAKSTSLTSWYGRPASRLCSSCGR
jgi:YVTN family beta-propeller protein